MTALPAALIGLGVGERHIAGYGPDPRCRVVALCDLDARRLKEVGARHPGARHNTDVASVFGDPDIDVVSVASYEPYHVSEMLDVVSLAVERSLGTGQWEPVRYVWASSTNRGNR